MKPLQDRCEPTPYEDVEALFLSDIGVPISDVSMNVPCSMVRFDEEAVV